VIPAALAVAALCAFHFFGIYVHPLAIGLTLVIIAVALIRATVWAAAGGWDCRIESGVLSWRSPQKDWSHLQLAELKEIVTVNYPNAERGHQYELLMKNEGRLVLDRRLVDFDFAIFKCAILAENREVIFNCRNGNLCYKCGEDLRVRRDVCPACGTAIPRQ